MAESGVGKGKLTFGDRLASSALVGVFPDEFRVDGVMSCVLLDLLFSLRGLGDPLRSAGVGDFGGTSGGTSLDSDVAPVVSTFNVGFGLQPGLRMGDNGFPRVLVGSSLL